MRNSSTLLSILYIVFWLVAGTSVVRNLSSFQFFTLYSARDTAMWINNNIPTFNSLHCIPPKLFYTRRGLFINVKTFNSLHCIHGDSCRTLLYAVVSFSFNSLHCIPTCTRALDQNTERQLSILYIVFPFHRNDCCYTDIFITLSILYIVFWILQVDRRYV